MRTIGRQWPRDAPRGDYPAMCGYCGVLYRRSQLQRDESGILVCPEEGEGKDVVTLSREAAENVREPENFERDAPGVERDSTAGRVDLFTLFRAPTW